MNALRKKLFNPPNAVPDTEIDLSRSDPNVVEFNPQDISLDGVRHTQQKELAAIAERCRAIQKKKLIKNTSPHQGGGILRKDAPLVAQFGLREIRIAVCEAWGISEIDLVGRRKFESVLYPRQVAYAMSAKFTRNSLPTIGRSLNRDHTSVLNGIRKMRPHINAVAAELSVDAPAIEWALAIKALIDKSINPNRRPPRPSDRNRRSRAKSKGEINVNVMD